MLGAAARRWVVASLSVVALLAVVGAVFGVTSIIEDSLIRTARRNAADDAEVLVHASFAGAISDGRLTHADLVAGEAQLAAARRTFDISRVLVWGPEGRLVYGNKPPTGRGARPHASSLVSRAMRTDTAQDAVGTDAGGSPDFSTAVPVGDAGRHWVAEFQFPRAAIDDMIGEVKGRLYLAAGIAAAALSLALLPLAGWIARRLPRKGDLRRGAELARLGRALDDGELCLHFQPKVSAESQQVLGVEALVRWQHPDRGLLSPDQFVPLLEDSHLGDRFTAYVLDAAADACGRWRGDGLHLPVAVNVAASALAGDHLVEQVGQVLERSGIPPEMLTLEITESGVMAAGADAAATLGALRRLGVAIAIDDFGTGYSSLFRITSLPVDELKIDRAFVGAMATDPHVARVVSLIADLGRQMELFVTAEGVETDAELRRLADLGCDAVQGFLFSPPLGEADLLKWMSRYGEPLSGDARGV